MADTILGGDFAVYYLAENRQKRIVWTGSSTGTRTVNELYSALADLMDENTQIDDGTAMSAQTPTEYTIGSIDPSDNEPWFIDRTSAEHLYLGAITTSGWLRVEGENTGIVRMAFNPSVGLISSDIGKDILMTSDGDRGTVLDYRAGLTGQTNYLWVRPDSSAAANSFNNAPTANGAWTIVSGTGTGVQTSGPALSGESLWANVYNTGLATLEPFTKQYVYQGSPFSGSQVKLGSYKNSESWWLDGQFDILVNTREVGIINDEGFVTVFARQPTKGYAFFTSDVSAGGRNPIPLQTSDDLNNTDGWRLIQGASGAGAFTLNTYIYSGPSWTLATKRGVITEVGGTTADPIITYFPIGDLTDFSASDRIHEYTGTENGDGIATVASGSDANGATYTDITVVHASNETFDIDENGTTENYSIVIDLLGTRTVRQAYEFSQHLTRRGGTTTNKTDGQPGESYIGSSYRITYAGLSGSIPEGSAVTQVGTLARGVVVAHNTTDNILVLRNTRGTFNNTGNIRYTAGDLVTGPTAVQVTPVGAAPYGLFAGGKWFCAPGIVLANVPSADANNYQLTDDGGNIVVAPSKVTVEITNTRFGDKMAIFRLTSAGGQINKSEYSASGAAAGTTTLTTFSGSITSDTAGKTAGGALRLIDNDLEKEYRIRFSSWTGNVFTLASTTGLVADAGSTSGSIIDAGVNFITSGSAQVGDIIRNINASGSGHIVAIVSDNQILTTVIPGQGLGNSYEINTLPVRTTALDTFYVPLVDKYETTGTSGTPGSESASVTYLADIPVLVRVRNAGDILPFEQETSVSATGRSVATIRTSDSIFNG